MVRKKKRNEAGLLPEPNGAEVVNGDCHEKKKKKKKKNNERDDEARETPTVSIALAGSIIDNAQSFDLATRVHLFLHSI